MNWKVILILLFVFEVAPKKGTSQEEHRFIIEPAVGLRSYNYKTFNSYVYVNYDDTVYSSWTDSESGLGYNLGIDLGYTFHEFASVGITLQSSYIQNGIIAWFGKVISFRLGTIGLFYQAKLGDKLDLRLRSGYVMDKQFTTYNNRSGFEIEGLFKFRFGKTNGWSLNSGFGYMKTSGFRYPEYILQKDDLTKEGFTFHLGVSYNLSHISTEK